MKAKVRRKKVKVKRLRYRRWEHLALLRGDRPLTSPDEKRISDLKSQI
jgi:hypothetical protein